MQETHKINCIFPSKVKLVCYGHFVTFNLPMQMPHCTFKITKKIKKKLPDLAENYHLSRGSEWHILAHMPTLRKSHLFLPTHPKIKKWPQSSMLLCQNFPKKRTPTPKIDRNHHESAKFSLKNAASAYD